MGNNYHRMNKRVVLRTVLHTFGIPSCVLLDHYLFDWYIRRTAFRTSVYLPFYLFAYLLL